MNLMMVLPSTLGCGEATVALDFIARLDSKAHKVALLAAASLKPVFGKVRHPTFWLMPGLGELNKLLARDIATSFDVEMIFVADLLTYQLHKSQFGIEEEFLESLSLPIVYFDLYGLSDRGYIVDTLGREPFVLNPKSLRPWTVVRPVPFANMNLGVQSPQDVFLYGFLPKQVNLARKQKMHVRDVLGCSVGEKLLLITTAPWQHRMMSLPWAQGPLDSLMLALQAFAKHIMILHVGPTPINHQVLGSRVKYKWIPPSEPEQFDVLLAACDLYLSMNAIASSLAKAIVYNVPSLLLVNSLAVEQLTTSSKDVRENISQHELVTDDATRVHKCSTGVSRQSGRFMIWPLGWFEFLSNVFRDNPYSRTFETAEVYDRGHLLSSLERNLFDSKREKGTGDRRYAYLNEVRKLPDPETVLKAMSERVP
jgi:hypothetical protein